MRDKLDIKKDIKQSKRKKEDVGGKKRGEGGKKREEGGKKRKGKKKSKEKVTNHIIRNQMGTTNSSRWNHKIHPNMQLQKKRKEKKRKEKKRREKVNILYYT